MFAATPGAITVPMPHGTSAPWIASVLKNPAPFTKLLGVTAGPGATAVRVNEAEKVPFDARIVIDPTPLPAVTVTEARPLLSVKTLLALKVAWPLVMEN